MFVSLFNQDPRIKFYCLITVESLELILSECSGFSSARGPAILLRFSMDFPESLQANCLQTGPSRFLPVYSQMALLHKLLRNNEFSASLPDMETIKSMVKERENCGLFATMQYARCS